MFADGCQDSMEENGTYGPACILWDFMCGSFIVVEVVLVWWMVVVEMDYVYGSKSDIYFHVGILIILRIFCSVVCFLMGD